MEARAGVDASYKRSQKVQVRVWFCSVGLTLFPTPLLLSLTLSVACPFEPSLYSLATHSTSSHALTTSSIHLTIHPIYPPNTTPPMATHTHHTKQEEMETIENASNILRPTPSNFERLYLAPEQPVAGVLRYTFANPTPIALAGFLLANTPATCMLMGWHGAGGGAGIANADTGAYFFCGGVLLYAGAIGEWILGNTFPAVVFFVSFLLLIADRPWSSHY